MKENLIACEVNTGNWRVHGDAHYNGKAMVSHSPLSLAAGIYSLSVDNPRAE